MDKIKAALETLDEAISELEERVGLDTSSRQQTLKSYLELLKNSKENEMRVTSLAHEIAERLDHSIDHVEQLLRH